MSSNTKMEENPPAVKEKPKEPHRKSLIERELETTLAPQFVSPITAEDTGNTSRYGRARRLKSDTDFTDTMKAVARVMHCASMTKIPQKSPQAYKMHASNSQIKNQDQESLKSPIISPENKLENQVKDIYNANISLSRFGSEEEKSASPVRKSTKTYTRKDLIQTKEKEETITLIKNMFSEEKSAKTPNSHIPKALEKSSEKYDLQKHNAKPQKGYLDNSSVVKTLDFDTKKKTKEKEKTESKNVLSKSDIFEMEAKCAYQVGDIAWARMGTFPFWPCIVTREPGSDLFVRKKCGIRRQTVTVGFTVVDRSAVCSPSLNAIIALVFGKIERDIVHVTFFADNGRRNWIADTMLRRYQGLREFEAARDQFTPEKKKKESKLYAAFFVSDKKLALWHTAIEEADLLSKEPKRLRIDLLNEMLTSQTTKYTLSAPKGGKITRTDSDVSLSESLFDTLFSEDDGSLLTPQKQRKKSLDVSEVVTACLDNMAAKTGMTKIQRQSHMDIWLQKAKSKTPEKSQFSISVAVERLDKEKECKEKLKKDKDSSTTFSSKKKRWVPPKEPVHKPYGFRKSTESQYLFYLQNEHDYSRNVASDTANNNDSNEQLNNEKTFTQSDSSICVIDKIESIPRESYDEHNIITSEVHDDLLEDIQKEQNTCNDQQTPVDSTQFVLSQDNTSTSHDTEAEPYAMDVEDYIQHKSNDLDESPKTASEKSRVTSKTLQDKRRTKNENANDISLDKKVISPPKRRTLRSQKSSFRLEPSKRKITIKWSSRLKQIKNDSMFLTTAVSKNIDKTKGSNATAPDVDQNNSTVDSHLESEASTPVSHVVVPEDISKDKTETEKVEKDSSSTIQNKDDFGTKETIISSKEDLLKDIQRRRPILRLKRTLSPNDLSTVKCSPKTALLLTGDDENNITNKNYNVKHKEEEAVEMEIEVNSNSKNGLPEAVKQATITAVEHKQTKQKKTQKVLILTKPKENALNLASEIEPNDKKDSTKDLVEKASKPPSLRLQQILSPKRLIKLKISPIKPIKLTFENSFSRKHNTDNFALEKNTIQLMKNLTKVAKCSKTNDHKQSIEEFENKTRKDEIETKKQEAQTNDKASVEEENSAILEQIEEAIENMSNKSTSSEILTKKPVVDSQSPRHTDDIKELQDVPVQMKFSSDTSKHAKEIKILQVSGALNETCENKMDKITVSNNGNEENGETQEQKVSAEEKAQESAEKSQLNQPLEITENNAIHEIKSVLTEKIKTSRAKITDNVSNEISKIKEETAHKKSQQILKEPESKITFINIDKSHKSKLLHDNELSSKNVITIEDDNDEIEFKGLNENKTLAQNKNSTEKIHVKNTHLSKKQSKEQLHKGNTNDITENNMQGASEKLECLKKNVSPKVTSSPKVATKSKATPVKSKSLLIDIDKIYNNNCNETNILKKLLSNDIAMKTTTATKGKKQSANVIKEDHNAQNTPSSRIPLEESVKCVKSLDTTANSDLNLSNDYDETSFNNIHVLETTQLHKPDEIIEITEGMTTPLIINNVDSMNIVNIEMSGTDDDRTSCSSRRVTETMRETPINELNEIMEVTEYLVTPSGVLEEKDSFEKINESQESEILEQCTANITNTCNIVVIEKPDDLVVQEAVEKEDITVNVLDDNLDVENMPIIFDELDISERRNDGLEELEYNSITKISKETVYEQMKEPEFLKYLELRQDSIMDEHPHLSYEEIVLYLYKTWQYGNLGSDERISDNTDDTNKLQKTVKKKQHSNDIRKRSKNKAVPKENSVIYSSKTISETVPPSTEPKNSHSASASNLSDDTSESVIKQGSNKEKHNELSKTLTVAVKIPDDILNPELLTETSTFDSISLRSEISTLTNYTDTNDKDFDPDNISITSLSSDVSNISDLRPRKTLKENKNKLYNVKTKQNIILESDSESISSLDDVALSELKTKANKDVQRKTIQQNTINSKRSTSTEKRLQLVLNDCLLERKGDVNLPKVKNVTSKTSSELEISNIVTTECTTPKRQSSRSRKSFAASEAPPSPKSIAKSDDKITTADARSSKDNSKIQSPISSPSICNVPDSETINISPKSTSSSDFTPKRKKSSQLKLVEMWSPKGSVECNTSVSKESPSNSKSPSIKTKTSPSSLKMTIKLGASKICRDVPITDTSEPKVNGFHDSRASSPDVQVKEQDIDTISIQSSDSNTSTRRKGRKPEFEPQKEPEFLQYLELRQDALMDDHPELTYEEIVAYLYKTWQYEENFKPDIKKNDELENLNLVKGTQHDTFAYKKKKKPLIINIRKIMNKETMHKSPTKEDIKDIKPRERELPKRKAAKPFYCEDVSDIEEEIEMFEIFKKTKPKTEAKDQPVGEVDVNVNTDTKMNKIEESSITLETPKLEAKLETKEDDLQENIEEEYYDEEELYFEQLTKPKPNVFRGMIREKVCEICEKTLNLVKCKGCNGMFHVDCVNKVAEIVETPVPTRGRKKSKKKRNRPKSSLESNEEAHSDEKSRDLNNSEENISVDEIKEAEPIVITNAEDFESKLEAKMKEIIDLTAVEYDSYSSDDGIDWTDTVAGKCEIVDVILKPRSKPESKDYSDFKCKNCQEHDTPICFVCKSAVSPKNKADKRQKCQVAHCHKFYHLECLERWPQTQFNAGEPSRNNKKIDEHFEALTCPRHVCHTCVCDDPRGCKTRFSGDKLARCVRCPATYHSFTKCLPAGSQILSASHIVCPRHYEHRPGKVPYHVNTGWCFICALGGNLICCDFCPTSFHADCLNIEPPEGGYMCEDCETGRLPLYGEMVWVKLGHYRWWPGIVLHPSEIPSNLLAVKHSPGEFVVRFFGQYDHYWVNRGRVFPFQEGDSGKVSNQKSKIDEAFTKAMEHAQRAFEILKNIEPNDEENQDIASSLLPPHYVKLKVNRPCGSLYGKKIDIEESSLTQCECDPNDEEPCGPYSHCLNRMLLTECGPTCRAGERCQNRQFEKREYPKLTPYRTPHRGWGLKTLEDIKAGQFVIEYVGELIDEAEFRRRMRRKHEMRDENFYFLTLDKERMIDAGPKGNLARFMNHCCEPNCETQKWTVLGDVRVGLFAIDDIPANTEVTFNYNLECNGIEKKQCMCGARRCAGYIGAKPKQDDPQPKKAKRQYKKRKTTDSPSTSSSSAPKTKPKRPIGRPPKPKDQTPRELTEIEKDLLIIKNATNGLSSDSEASGRLSSIDAESDKKDKDLKDKDLKDKPLKRKRVSFSTEEVLKCNGPSYPSVKRLKLEGKSEVGD